MPVALRRETQSIVPQFFRRPEGWLAPESLLPSLHCRFGDDPGRAFHRRCRGRSLTNRPTRALFSPSSLLPEYVSCPNGAASKTLARAVRKLTQNQNYD